MMSREARQHQIRGEGYRWQAIHELTELLTVHEPERYIHVPKIPIEENRNG